MDKRMTWDELAPYWQALGLCWGSFETARDQYLRPGVAWTHESNPNTAATFAHAAMPCGATLLLWDAGRALLADMARSAALRRMIAAMDTAMDALRDYGPAARIPGETAPHWVRASAATGEVLPDGDALERALCVYLRDTADSLRRQAQETERNPTMPPPVWWPYVRISVHAGYVQLCRPAAVIPAITLEAALRARIATGELLPIKVVLGGLYA